jgi:hypothetical protein
MGPDVALMALEAAVRAAHEDRRLRYEAITLRSADGIVLGQVGKRVQGPDDGDPRPVWAYTLEQCERMVDTIVAAARSDAGLPNGTGT